MDARTLVRRTDPDTSYEAALSLSSERLSWCRRMILALLRQGALTDEQIADRWAEVGSPQSPSSLRTRRAELVDAGLVRDSGRHGLTRSGRRTIIWEPVPREPEQQSWC